jgi:outer membrane protein
MKIMNTILKSLLLILILAGTSMTVQAQKFGYINAQELIKNMPEVKEANANIETLTKQLEKKSVDMKKAFQTKYQSLQAKQQNGEISPKQLETEAALLETEQKKIEEYDQTSIQKIEEKNNQLLTPIIEKVNSAIKDVADENGYTYVFDYSVGIILYADESTDITELVKTKLGIVK